MEELKVRLEDHMKQDENSLGLIFEEIRVIKENHLAHIEPSVASIQTDVSWLKNYLSMLVVPIVGGFITALYALITR